VHLHSLSLFCRQLCNGDNNVESGEEWMGDYAGDKCRRLSSPHSTANPLNEGSKHPNKSTCLRRRAGNIARLPPQRMSHLEEE